MMPGRWRITLLAVGLLAGLACEPTTSDWTRLEIRVPAPDFSLPRLNGQTVRLSDLRGQIVIMEFWATWCGPCRQSTPSLDVIYRRFRDRGVTVLLINQGESTETIREWAGTRFVAPMLLDQRRAVAARYQVAGIPRLFIIDRDGQIVYDHSGYGGGLERNLTIILDELLEQARVPTDA